MVWELCLNYTQFESLTLKSQGACVCILVLGEGDGWSADISDMVTTLYWSLPWSASDDGPPWSPGITHHDTGGGIHPEHNNKPLHKTNPQGKDESLTSL